MRIEPYVVQRRLSRASIPERVDTRVVQLIHAIAPGHKLVKENKVLVGQLVDAFIDVKRDKRVNEPAQNSVASHSIGGEK